MERSKQLTLFDTNSGSILSRGIVGFDPTVIASSDASSDTPLLALNGTRVVHLYGAVH